MQQVRNPVAEEFEAVNRLIIEQLHSDVPLVENIGHYIVDAGGKRLRPLLVLLSGGACSSLTKEHIPLAAVIEFIHTATLLHDDVVDISALRRGRPTANASWGNAPSVLVGDFLYSRAFQMLVALGNMEVMALLSDTTNIIAEGEVLQLTKAGDPATTEEEYYQVIENKTAVLFAAAAKGGAILSCSDDILATNLHHYGLHLGFAFQLIDDLLDYQGDPELMGKNVGDDLSEGKPTLPLIFTIRNGNTAQRELIQSAIKEKSSRDIEKVIAAVSQSGALEYTRQAAINQSLKAKEHLASLPDNHYKQALLRIADLSVSRSA